MTVDSYAHKIQTQADTFSSGWFDRKSQRDRDNYNIAPSVFKTPSAVMFQTGFHLKPLSKPNLTPNIPSREIKVARETQPATF